MEITETTPMVGIELKGSEVESITIRDDKQVEEIVKALSSKTRRDILSLIQQEPMDVSKIAAILAMTEANISAQIKKLEKAGLINCDYKSGQHGVRKISHLTYKKLVINF